MFLLPLPIVAVAFAIRAIVLRFTGGDSAPGWQVRCPKCGLTFDAGDLGIVRIAAIGRTNLYRKCGQCKKLRWLSVERKPDDLPPHAGPRCDLKMRGVYHRSLKVLAIDQRGDVDLND